MIRLRTIFGRLQWKLTLSYTLVTSAVVIVLLLLVLLLAWTLLFRSNVLDSALAGAMAPLADDLIPVLAEEPPSPARARAWLDSHYEGRTLRLAREGGSTSLTDVALVGVTGAGGELLAAAPGQWADLAALPRPARTVIAAALAEASTASRTIRDETGGGLFLATPVRGESGVLLGALFVQMDIPATREALVQALFSGLLPAMLPILVSAGLVGTLFGFVAARGLTRRLHALATTADAWSRGDFTTFVRDSSADEIGELGRRLNRMAEQLQNLLQTREELAAVDERNRLARELHDAVKQQLFATSMQIGAAQERLEDDPLAAERHLVEAATLALQAQRELGVLIQELRPMALSDGGLAEALEKYTADWSRQSGVAVQLDLGSRSSLSPRLEQALFRVAQEALANVARHSGARRATLTLQKRGNSLVLEVRDDGRGFDPQMASSGYGLDTMRQRLAALDGRLAIHSEPGLGTTITADVPLNEEKQP
jgi:NarL family two-component system sensor histidine kinase LiaS